MRTTLNRRTLLRALAVLPIASGLRLGDALAAPAKDLGPAAPFDFARLIERARALADEPPRETPPKHPDLLERIDYDTYQTIRFNHERALWADTPSPVEFFHLGRYAKRPVAIHLVADGEARRLRYDPRFFDTSETGLSERLPDDLGFAGFRVMNPGGETDWLAFQGASYFRSAGELDQYGLSARGIAVDTALPETPEAFPRFTAFWLERPAADGSLRLHALLEGDSVTGAYRFDCRPGDAVVMDVRAELFQRRAIERLGIAPLTSMYWYSETNHRRAPDWRPEIHDSDGLALWTGAGERIWRPLNNPPRTQTTSYVDRDPRGFGLLQRDRDFDHYQDDGVFYDRRPSVWVEPLGAWGDGEVQLVELPTDDEIHDNIVAYWVPAAPAEAGRHWRFDYRLHWVAEEPHPPAGVARVRATRIGRPGVPGQHEARDPDGRKFAIDFSGGPLADMAQRYDLDVVVETSRGRIDNPYALKVVGTDRWRAVFDLHADGAEPVDLRCHVRLGDRALTETWLYQYFPKAWGTPS
ncbi:glucan biosynthesis protein D [Salinisphaera sp. PC39]|uniref:glucan biosynthesis protein n=1 Tax=Salinisphaera sp. PC39 TaxID=1304156 RepID=UPI00333FA0F4